MTEQLYIDGKLTDTLVGTGAAQLVYQSPYFTDIESVVSNRTNEITLPFTNRNRALLGYAGTQGEGTAMYEEHDAIYKRDGVQLLHGKARITAVKQDGFKVVLIWGNYEAYEPLLNMRLRDLMDWNNAGDYVHPLTRTESRWDSLGYESAGQHAVPRVLINEVLTKIRTKAGITFDISRWTDYALQLTTEDYPEDKKQEEQAVLNYTSVWRSNENRYVLKCSRESDVLNLWGTGTDNYKFLPKPLGITTFKVRLPQLYATSSPVAGQQFRAAVYGVKNVQGGEAWTELWASENTFSTTSTAPEEETPVLKTNDGTGGSASAYDYIAIGIGTVASTATPTLQILDDIVITPEPDYMVRYPLWYNLPDWSALDLLKNLMWISGLFAYCEQGQIRFTNINELRTNRQYAPDWTNKVMQVEERAYKVDGLAQRNWLRYTAHETAKEQHDAYVEVKDKTLDWEQDLITLGFAAVDLWDWYAQHGGQRIPVYQPYSVGDTPALTGLPPVLLMKHVYGVRTTYIFDRSQMDWDKLKATRYAEYAAMVEYPKTLKVRMRLLTADLVNLDLRVPVYLRQTGRYYCIKSITAGAENMADVELIQL